MTAVNELISDVVLYQYNPSGIQRAALRKLTEATNGEIEVVDPTNPFVFCLEAAACMTAGYMIKNEASNRKQYAIAAQDSEDLYYHMSDKDYIDRFAVPSRTTFTLTFPVTELVDRMVDDTLNGIRKIVIPRNTFFTVAGTVFSLQYPIEIRQLAHGGLQVLFDASTSSPLQTLETNFINHQIISQATGDYLVFEVDVQQFSILSQKGTLNAATDFKVSITLDDQFYYARVYVEDSSGYWAEIKTTHSDQIYDPKSPTAVLRVIDKTVTVIIPQIYTSTSLLNRAIRMDIYQTKGPLEMILWEYPVDAFTATWQAYDKADNTIFSAPLSAFRNIMIYSDKVVTGGQNALSFEELRTRVITNAMSAPDIPITNVQIENVLTKQGYQVIKNIDSITNRIFVATKEMPTPTVGLTTPASASIETVSFTLNDARHISTNIDNDFSVTLTPKTLYKNVNGVTSMVPAEEIDWLMALPADKRAYAVTTGGYLYTPFHYVLDTSTEEFDSRPYYLDDPVIDTKIFVSENDTTMLQVGAAIYGVVRTNTGYMIQIVLNSSDAFKALDDSQVYVQLAFVPYGEKDRAYLNGVFAGLSDSGERIYNFDLSTNFYLDSNHQLMLEKFLMYSTEPRLSAADLLTDFDLLIATTAQMPTTWRYANVDSVLGRFLLPPNTVGITHEKLRVRFGYALETLWARARSVITEVDYKTYAEDVPRVYEEDIYARDDLGSAISFDEAGNPVMTLLHAKGDPVLDSEGNVIYQYRRGDIMYDDQQQPIPVDARDLLRQTDIMMIEGAYWFATDLSSIKYRTTLTLTVVDWIMNDLAKLSGKLLEQTRVYFYPKTTLGAINVVVEDGLTKKITAAQAFNVTLYVSDIVYNNTSLKEKISSTTISALAEQLKKTTVTLDGIIEALRQRYGTDVISVQVEGLGGVEKLQAITVVDASDRCSLRKRLTAQPDGSMQLEEDVTITFLPHEAPVI